MKRIHIIGFLTIICAVYNIQSMELPTQYPLEKQLLLGEISPERYLLLTPSFKAHEIATTEYLDPARNYYINLISVLQRKRSLYVSHIKKHGFTDELLEQFRNAVKLLINVAYSNLVADIEAELAALEKST